ncbi:hypothetical protein BDV26DRAFT_271611 [Aspergillus bertholletiae]|uniref:Uncharacterized protein n=1 Tax=Aspergillus bertholletiae TaxID=1226010 RepID=A0A5N7AUW1_9EURO|nr:hypothetical protein BDV26DRAFT_271611 [Aspergillus bertholletiae]
MVRRESHQVSGTKVPEGKAWVRLGCDCGSNLALYGVPDGGLFVTRRSDSWKLARFGGNNGEGGQGILIFLFVSFFFFFFFWLREEL